MVSLHWWLLLVVDVHSINCWNECELNQKGWVMNCKHIVCNECIENNDESSIMCSICQTEKDYATDFQHTIYNSGMDDDREYIEQLQQKLIGLNPQLINEMATNAINFWIFQVLYQYLAKLYLFHS